MDNSNSSSSESAGQSQPAINQPAQTVPQQQEESLPSIPVPAAPVTPPASTPVQQPIVGSVSKEAGPIAEVSTHEVMAPSGEHVEPQIAPEVQEAGVTAVKEVPDLTLHDKKAGIQLAKDAVPHPTSPSGTVQLPYTEEEAKEIIKKEKDPKKARYWIAVEVLRQLHRKITNS